MSSIVGIDFGNENCLVSVPNRGSIEIVQNESSQRITPSVVAYSENRRYYGVFAAQQQMQNVKSTIIKIKQLVGMRWNSKEREIIQKSLPYEICEMDKDDIGIVVDYLGKKTTFKIEQVLGFLLRGLFLSAQNSNIYADQCVIVVSNWWGEREKRMLIDAGKIAGVKVLRLLNSTTAAAITYALIHKKKLTNNSEKDDEDIMSAFIDFGECSLNVSIISMRKDLIAVKGSYSNPNLGGNNFSEKLTNYLLEKTKEKYKIDPTTNQRAMLRFRTAVEKLKKGLSANPIMQFEVMSLMNDIDVQFTVKRTEFEDQIKDLLEEIQEPIENSLKIANVQKEQLKLIEVHGGTSRIPLVKAKITEIFGKQPTQSLNPDECFAMGAGFDAAIISPQYRISFNVNEISKNQIMIKWTKPSGEIVDKELFKPNQPIPSTKIVSIKMNSKAEVEIYNEISKIGKIEIESSSNELKTAKIRIRLTEDDLIDVQDVVYNIEKEGDEKSTEKKAKFTYIPFYGLSEDMINLCIQQEKEMHEIDVNELKIDSKKNELESYIFQLNNAIDRDYPEYFDPNLLDEYKSKISEIRDWFFDNEFERFKLNEYESRLDILKNFGQPAYKRKNFRQKIPSSIDENLKKANSDISQITNSKANDNEKQQIIKEINEYIKWLNMTGKKVEETPKYQEAPYDPDEAQNKLYRIEQKIQKIIKRIEDEIKKKQEEENKRKQEELRKKQEEENKKKQEEDNKKKQEEDNKKKQEEEENKNKKEQEEK